MSNLSKTLTGWISKFLKMNNFTFRTPRYFFSQEPESVFEFILQANRDTERQCETFLGFTRRPVLLGSTLVATLKLFLTSPLIR